LGGSHDVGETDAVRLSPGRVGMRHVVGPRQRANVQPAPGRAGNHFLDGRFGPFLRHCRQPRAREIELDGLEAVLRNPRKNAIEPTRPTIGPGKYSQLHHNAPCALATSTLLPLATDCAIATIVLIEATPST